MRKNSGHPLFISKAECKTPEDFERFEREQELRRKGRRMQKASNRKRRKMMEDLDEMLGLSFAELKEKKDLNSQQEILLSQMIEARNGNTKAFESIRDSAGEKPKNDIDLNANMEALKNMQELAKAMLGISEVVDEEKKEDDE